MSHDRGHRSTQYRYVSVASIPKALADKLGFSSAAQFVSVYRERGDLGDHMESDETS